MEPLTFKAKVEVDAMLEMDPDGSNPRIVIREQTVKVDPSELEWPKLWCSAEDGYLIKSKEGMNIETTCGAVRRMKG